MEVTAKMKELMEKHAEEEMEMEQEVITGGEAEENLLEAIFGEAPEIHIDTVNIHIGDHVESVNYMGEVEEEEETPLIPVEVDITEMKEAISTVMKVPPCIVEKVFEGMKLYLESLSEVDGHDCC